MKNLLITFLLFCFIRVVYCENQQVKEKTVNFDIKNSPLNHKSFKIIDYPQSCWVEGGMNLSEAMGYLFKSKPERELAIKRLLEAGYGKGKNDFIYVNGKDISVNGQVFSNIQKAKEYIKKHNIKKLLYSRSGAFPQKVPENIKIEGVQFWLIDWRK